MSESVPKSLSEAVSSSVEGASVPATRGLRFWSTLAALAVIVAVGVALRAYRVSAEQVWADEVISMMPLQAPTHAEYFPLLRSLDPPSVPVYFLMLYHWQDIFGWSALAFRWLSMIWGILSIPLIYLVARRLYGTGAGLAAAAALTFSLGHILYSQEIRPYALTLFFELGSVYTLLEALRTGRFRWWSAHGVVNLLMVFTHAMSALLIFAEGLFLLTFYLRRLKIVIPWGLYHAALAVLLGMWLVPRAPGIAVAAAYMQPPALDEVARRFLALTGCANPGNPMVYGWRVYPAYALAALAVLFVLHQIVFTPSKKRRRSLMQLVHPPAEYGLPPSRGEHVPAEATAPTPAPSQVPAAPWPRREAVTFVLYWLLFPPLFILAASYLGRPCFQMRYVLCAVLASCVLAGGATTLIRHWAPQAALAAVVVALYAGQAVNELPNRPLRYPIWTEIIDYIQPRMKPEDDVVITADAPKRPGIIMACDLPGRIHYGYADTFCRLLAEKKQNGLWFISLTQQPNAQIEQCIADSGRQSETKPFPSLEYRVYHVP